MDVRSTLSALIHVIVWLCGTACAYGLPDTDARKQCSDDIVIFERDLPPHAQLLVDDDRRTVRFLQGRDLSSALEEDPGFARMRAGRDLEGLARTFLASYKQGLRILSPAEEFQVKSKETDGLGFARIRLGQAYHGIPVHGSELVVQLDPELRINLVTGRYIATPRNLELTPQISSAQARAATAADVGMSSGCTGCGVELVIFKAEGDPPALAYAVYAEISLGEAWTVLVDAVTAAIIYKELTVHTREAR